MADMTLTPEELGELKETFEYNDLDGDGKIEFNEFFKMLNALEAGATRQEARIGFDEVDTDDNGLIDLDEFVAWWTER
jgi:Ca2+-binding EF-hand superfamily protein